MTAYCILFIALGVALFCSGCATFAMRGHRCNGVPMRVMLLDKNAYNLRRKLPGPMPELKYITIHNTANRVSAVEERNYLNNRRDNVSVSYHYAVDEKEVVQLIPDDQHAWHAGDGTGDGNMKSISIEICRSLCRDKENYLYLRSEDNAVRFTAWLLKKHGLSVDCLRMHKDWSGKNCPHRILEADSWDDFKKRVAAAMKLY